MPKHADHNAHRSARIALSGFMATSVLALVATGALFAAGATLPDLRSVAASQTTPLGAPIATFAEREVEKHGACSALLGSALGTICFPGADALACPKAYAQEAGDYASGVPNAAKPGAGIAASDAADASAAETDANAATSANAAAAASASTNAVRVTDSIGELLQYPELPAGCESVALTIVLRAMGYELAPTEIADAYLPIDATGGDYVHAYAGDPRSSGGALAPALVTTANAYLTSHGAPATARNLTGTSFADVLAKVEAGIPILVWTTSDQAAPRYSGEVREGFPWYFNEHCVVLYGIDGDRVLVSDPIDGLIARDAAAFQSLYETCGSMAVAVA